MVNVLNCDLIALRLFTLTLSGSYFPFLAYSCFQITPNADIICIFAFFVQISNKY